MDKHVLFLQGGGNEGYETDASLVASLQETLGKAYQIHYPRLQTDERATDFGWPIQIGKEIKEIKGDIILVAHSLGASMLMKFLSENAINKKIGGVFLIAMPFWSGDEDWVQGLKLRENFADNLPPEIPIFLYHCIDDEVAPFKHLSIYAQKLPQAITREIASGGHQLNNDLSLIAKDIAFL